MTFLSSTAILIAANFLSRLIGYAYKIPLANLIKPEGMGLYSTAYSLFAFMFTLATAGFPLAISKMVAESPENSRKILKISTIILSILGVVSALILCFGAPFFAQYFKNSQSVKAIQAISPALIFIALSCAFRGYFQGKQKMAPTALSNVLEALGKLIFGYFLAVIMFPKGTEFAAAGASFGVFFGALLSFLGLWLWFAVSRKKEQPEINSISWQKIAKTLLITIIPFTVAACVQSITQVFDAATIPRILQLAKNATETEANAAFGAYSGFVLPIFSIPLYFVTAVGMAALPSLTALLAEKKTLAAKKFSQKILSITGIFAIICALGMFALAPFGLKLIFGSNMPQNAPYLLRVLSFAAIFSSLLPVTNAILQSYGKVNFPMLSMGIGAVLKLGFNVWGISKWGLVGAPIATNICYFAIVVINLLAINRVWKAYDEYNR